MEYYGTSFWAPTNTLSHHGIKGQKWGVRRWQNSDGSFNEAGKKRYFSDGGGENYKKLRIIGSPQLAGGRGAGSRVQSRIRKTSGKRFGSIETSGKPTREEKKQIRKEYRADQRKRNAELRKINEKHDKAKTENIFSFDSGGATDRVKKHLKNEYERSQEINKWDQKNLDAKRAYREKIGKKKVETWLMKAQQDAINEISNQTQAEFNKEYAEYLLREAASTVINIRNSRNSGG